MSGGEQGVAHRVLRPCDRNTWERLIRGARLGGLIKGSGKAGKEGRTTRGGVSAGYFLGVALAIASYANPDGSEVRPGGARLIVDTEIDPKIVRAVVRFLVDVGLLQLVRRSRSRGSADEYRLTEPSDLRESMTILEGQEYRDALEVERLKASGKPRTVATGPSAVQGPQASAEVAVQGPPAPVDDPRTGACGPAVLGPQATPTYPWGKNPPSPT
ncbi:hypothetical protein E1091_07500, partial [Micromonospora fluostatini]